MSKKKPVFGLLVSRTFADELRKAKIESSESSMVNFTDMLARDDEFKNTLKDVISKKDRKRFPF